MPRPRGRPPKARAERAPLSAAQQEALDALHARQRARKEGRAPDGAMPNPLDAHAPAREPARARVSAAVRRDCKTVLAFAGAGLDKAARFVSERTGRGFWTAEDQLSKDETTHIVNAVYGELSEYPKVVEWIAGLATGQKHGYLVYVASMIGLPRLIRHGIVREDDPVVAAVLFAQFAISQQLAEQPPADDEPPAAPEPTVFVAPGAASIHSGGNGYGQVDPSFVPVAVPDLGDSLAEQTG